MRCPQCGGECEAEFVDIGVGMQQVTPYGCVDCEWYEGKGQTEEVVMTEHDESRSAVQEQDNAPATDSGIDQAPQAQADANAPVNAAGSEPEASKQGDGDPGTTDPVGEA